MQLVPFQYKEPIPHDVDTAIRNKLKKYKKKYLSPLLHDDSTKLWMITYLIRARGALNKLPPPPPQST
jgi:hypothetical protein